MSAPVDSVRLARLLETAEADLHTASGGAPLCKVSMTGTTGQSVKYFEGRWAALREVQRGADAQEAFNAWRKEYERHQQIDSGQAWLHYSAGGVDALFELLD
ncbi:MAG: hypothetical protein O2815_01610 [Actinomycetota bacterium]|nr:hypothetical protein [Actinomycetota bacterium]